MPRQAPAGAGARRLRIVRAARAAAALAAGLAGAGSAGATDLLQAWQAARSHDLEFVAASAAHDAGAARRDQGRALWRPTVALVGTAGRMSSTTDTEGAQFSAPGFGTSTGVAFNTSISDGNATRWAVSARQPLISGERLAQGRQLALAADVADLQWQAAQQALILRTAERYFELALAEQTLRVLREQQAAAEQALGESQERFRVGDIPITDSLEAGARAAAIRAQVLAAETDLQIKQLALADLTGIAPQELHPLVPQSDTGAAAAGTLDGWLGQAAQDNPDLLARVASVDVARQEAQRYAALATPSLDLVAEVGRDRLSGSGDFGPASNLSSSRMIGLQLTVPLFTGGYRSARHSEALRLADQSSADADRTRQQIVRNTRAAWLGLTVGANRVAALAAARDASNARLEATRLGHEVGDRTTLDLLNAQSDAASAELALVQGRIGLLTEQLRLAALGGTLDEAQLSAVNQHLQHP